MEAWLLDVYPVKEGMRLWVVDEEGRSSTFVDRWSPHFYVARDHASVQSVLKSFQCSFSVEAVERQEFFSRQAIPVTQVRVGSPLLFSRISKTFLEAGGFELFNADVNLGQSYFYERGLFPLAKFSYELDKEGFLGDWQINDSPWEIDYAMPPLRYARLGLEGEVDQKAKASSRSRAQYVLSFDKKLGHGKTIVMDSSEEDLIRSLNHYLEEWDPDVLLSDFGDGFLMQKLRLHSHRSGVPLRLSRDTSKPVSFGRSSTFFSYGKIIHKEAPSTLFGRLHIDTKNSFMVDHTALEGLFEIARVAKIPIQRAARSTIGTALSSMQFDWAVKNNVLIPYDKGQTEDFRSAEDLIASDRGGLVYEPEVGWFENIIEFDFASMYPEIMIRKNVTPEAVNCPCCSHNTIPGGFHHLCERRGMVPEVLKPLVDKRTIYKKLIKQKHPNAKAFKARYDAFKWALVCCFGYLGFRNARFGRIEAHECVNAYSRESLLLAKETAEAAGFRMLHAIVDSLWLEKPGATDEEVEQLRQKIEQVTGLPLGLEGRYRWVRFCPSRVNPLNAVPTRYFGVFNTGEPKIRGIELRRHDAPRFVKDFQQEVLDLLSNAASVQELMSLRPAAEEILINFKDRLKSGQVSALDLAMTLRLSKEPSAYVHDTLSAVAAKQMDASGINLGAGEMIQYVVADEKSPVKDWRVMPLALISGPFEYDTAYYERLLDRAYLPFFGEEPTKKKRRNESPARPAAAELFPLPPPTPRPTYSKLLF